MTWVTRHQSVSILDFIGAKDEGDGGDNWNYKTCCKTPVTSSLPTYKHQTFYTPDDLPCSPTNSIRALKRDLTRLALRIN